VPDWTGHLRARLSTLRLNPAREAEIVEELSQHLEERYAELRAGGISDAEARRLALDELREPEALAEYMRPLRQAHVPPPVVPGSPRGSLFRDLMHDLRYGFRTLRKEPAFAAAAVLTLALGIGANSAIFALVDATLLRPLPYPQPDRLVRIWGRTATTARDRVAPADIVDWNARTRTFQAIGGFRTNVGGMVLADADGLADTVPRQWVQAGIFDALGVKPVAGRTFLPSDVAEQRNVVILSEAFWRSRFNADPSVIGRTLRLDGGPWTVIGVVPKEAQLIGRTSMWALERSNTRGAYLYAIGRLKPGVTLDAASADLNNVAAALAREFPGSNAGRAVAIEPLHDVVVGGELRRTSLLFLGVVGFVLLICCANVANLLLARATVRRRELAIRAALGADRARVVRQLLTESLVLSMIGAALGLIVGAAMLNAAPALIPPDLLSVAVTPAFNLRVVAFCAAAALLVGLVFGLAPAWHATDVAPSQALASDSRSVTGRGGRLREVIVAVEIATAVLLVFGAGLLLRTLIAVESVDRGYRADDALTMIVDAPFGEAERLRQFYGAVEREVLSMPGVHSVAWATTLPFGRSYQGGFFFEIIGDPPLPESRWPTADYQIVSPSYFRALDLPIVAGRAFSDGDRPDSTRVCLVNEAFVRVHAAGRSPIGLRVTRRRAVVAGEPREVCEIVGVVRQVKERPDATEEFVQIYAALAQDTPGDIFLLVRPTTGSAAALASPVRAAIGRVDRQQTVSVRTVMTLQDVASEATARHRFRAVLVMTFAALALLLAMVGVFGVLAYSVEQRIRDFGLRKALGATTADVLRLVAGSAARVIAAGALVGLVLSAAVARLLEALLFGVEPLDLVTFASVTIVLAVTAALSAAGPAWRAARVDPAAALRAE